MEQIDTFFLACFAFGALFTVASAFLGGTIHLGHAGHVGGGHVGHHAPALHQGHAPPAHSGTQVANGAAGSSSFFRNVPLVNPSSLLAFLTWFGAAGYILFHVFAWGLLATLTLSAAIGIVGWVAVAFFLRFLLLGETELDPEESRLEGTVARVSVAIPAGGGSGEITFSREGGLHSEAARSFGGLPLPRDAEVVVTSYKRGFAIVQPWADFVGESRIFENDPPSLTQGQGGPS